MRRFLILTLGVGAFALGVGCSDADKDTGPRKDLPPRMLKPGQTAPNHMTSKS